MRQTGISSTFLPTNSSCPSVRHPSRLRLFAQTLRIHTEPELPRTMLLQDASVGPNNNTLSTCASVKSGSTRISLPSSRTRPVQPKSSLQPTSAATSNTGAHAPSPCLVSNAAPSTGTIATPVSVVCPLVGTMPAWPSASAAAATRATHNFVRTRNTPRTVCFATASPCKQAILGRK